MKSKILKTFLFFALFSVLLITNSFAADIKEKSEDYKELGAYIIGSTRFDGNKIVTATMAANAGVSETKLNLALGKDISNLKLTTYFYDELFEEWNEIKENGETKVLNESEAKVLEENLNIFFVNNEEKVIDVPYEGTVDEDSIWSPNDNVTFENNVFKVPVFTMHFTFYSNGVVNTVNTNVFESVLNGEDIVENLEIIPEWAEFEANGEYYTSDSIDEVLANEEELEIKLLQDIDLPTALKVAKKVTIDLNWCNLTVTEDTAGDGVFHVVEGGDLTINGDGIVDGVGKNKWNIVVFADGGKVTINGGMYTNINTEILDDDTDSNHFDVIYAKGNGSVVINGGNFSGITPAWLLNLHDGSRTTASIIVKGGTFIGLNPANSAAEGVGTNFVAEGYKVEADVENNEYTVVELEEYDMAITNGIAYQDLQIAVDEMEAGATVRLLQDIDLLTALEVSKKVIIDLNNCNLTVKEDTAGDGVFHVVEGGDLTINGNGIVDGVGNNIWNIVVFADGGHVTINGGTYTNTNVIVSEDDTDSDHFDVIYAKGKGSVEINGGRFEGKTPAWLLNLHDGSRTTASISVKGGTFVEFDPSNNAAEGEGTNFVADGYVSTPGANNVYTVDAEAIAE